MSEILNKAETTVGKIQYHVRVKPGDVGKYVLLPGDPARTDLIAQFLDNPRLVANHREYRTYTGEYRGITVSATSTGIGCPSAAIAVEELANVGAEVFIRVGSTAALQPGIHIGDLIINTGAMKNEGTSRFHVPQELPAVPDFFFTRALVDTAADLAGQVGFRFHVGLGASDDSFYGETQEWIQHLHKLRLLHVEMEASAIYSVAHMRGLRAAMVCAVSGNLVTGEVIYEQANTGLAKGWEHEIQLILEAIHRFHHGRH